MFDARRRTVLGAALGALSAVSTPAWAAPTKKKKAANRPPRPMRPGQALWMPELSPSGPVVAAVNLHTQHMQLYRNGVAIGYSSISSGRPSHPTPVGVFNVLQKHKDHFSTTYDNAPMPWMVRLTWDGVAFHAGTIPGYPASHGCIRLPRDFAPKLYRAIGYGDSVLVVRQSISAGQQPLTTLAPIDPAGNPLVHSDMLQDVPWWAPEPQPQESALETALEAALETALAAPAAPASAASDAAEPQAPEKPVEPPPQPLALLASISQKRLFVLRDGQVVAAAPLPAGAYDAVKGALGGRRLLRWHEEGRWAALGKVTKKSQALNGDALDNAVWSEALPGGEFAERLRTLLIPGSTLLLSDMAAVGDVHTAAWKYQRTDQQQ